MGIRGLFVSRGRTALAVAVVASVISAGFTIPAAAAERCTITGTAGDEILRGTDGDDVICGDYGRDTIFAGGGNDVVWGGDGDDVIHGDGGDDVLHGENGADSVYAGEGADEAFGGPGGDTIDAGPGDDEIVGASGPDVVLGGEGTDRIDVGAGEDVVDGGPGADVILAGADADQLFGGSANDSIDAGVGTDRLWGGPGDDVLDGGKDPDACDGGRGANTYRNCDDVSETGADEVWPDADGDGLADVLELRAASDPLDPDTDGDGLSDAFEIPNATDPTLPDTDADGVGDAGEDLDADQLSHAQEAGVGTRAVVADTDEDGLDDGDEVARGTNPLIADTDGDGLTDHEEIELGTDPLVGDTDGDGTGDGSETFSKDYALADTGVVFAAVGVGRAVLAAQVDRSEDERLHDVPGQRAPPVDVDAPVPLVEGTLTIPFDAAGLPQGSEIRVLHFDEETGTFDIPANQTVDLDAGVATVTTSDFSPFLVADVSEFEQIWANEITVPRDGSGEGANLDVVITLDSSGSMTSNDPSGLRKTAAKSFVDALISGDQAGVVDFDSSAIVRQQLTTDFSAVKSAIDAVNSSGGTSLAAGMNAALNELDARAIAGHQRVVLFLTDGQGTYSSSYTTRAKDSDTVVYTVGLGSGTDTALLDSIATQTGGKFYLVRSASDLPETFDRIGGDLGAPDADGDGLADVTETGGWHDGSGRFFHTDPADPDTDSDGITDGEEAGSVLRGGAFGSGMYFNARSNPTKVDTDNDNLSDLAEIGHGTSAWHRDLDRDGYTDSEEVELHSTEPFNADTDVDGHDDPYEVERLGERDPLLFEREVLWYEYFGDFSSGALCGDITGLGGFCDPRTEAFIWGVVAGGFIPLIDIRDIVANLANGDMIMAGVSMAGLIPLAGDAASALVRLTKATLRAPEAVAGSVVRAVMKATDRTPAEKLRVLADSGAARAVDRLRSAAIDDDVIVRLATRAISPKHFDDMIAGASAVNKGSAFYRLEKNAEQFLRARTPGALDGQILTKLETPDGTIRRYYDVLAPQTQKAIEVKHGRAYGIGRAGQQIATDVTLRGSDPAIRSVEWHFFPNTNGTIGPDQQLLDLLMQHAVPYTIWVP
ncbi:MAG: hypothetical protein K0R99_4702 [Microbacterium sp.]|uniref:VWA domain-containing protein n=1 Tax=Microbacterium sp. TaxID=51671 RepID=UPI00260B78CC|nr:VWA domain-containing protein [Microbacterium sp.]MDF2563256.1 hypothetical protein [Microbacterium sp.]